MIMNKRILYLLSVLCFFSFSACTSEEEPVLTEELGEIWLSVVDTSKVEVVTRALSGFDVKDFNVSLSRGETMVFSSRNMVISPARRSLAVRDPAISLRQRVARRVRQSVPIAVGAGSSGKRYLVYCQTRGANGSNAEMCLGKLLGKCRVQRFYQEKPLGLRYHPVTPSMCLVR